LENSLARVKPKGLATVLDLLPPADSQAHNNPRNGCLTEADAVDIWIARWLRIRLTDLLQRYGCDPRRIYEIWEGTRFAGSRAKAWAIMQQRHPELVDRVDPGNHKRMPRAIRADAQPGLFD
jgi:hypothetical protein